MALCPIRIRLHLGPDIQGLPCSEALRRQALQRRNLPRSQEARALDIRHAEVRQTVPAILITCL